MEAHQAKELIWMILIFSCAYLLGAAYRALQRVRVQPRFDEVEKLIKDLLLNIEDAKRLIRELEEEKNKMKACQLKVSVKG